MGSIAYMTLEDRGFYTDESFLLGGNKSTEEIFRNKQKDKENRSSSTSNSNNNNNLSSTSSTTNTTTKRSHSPPPKSSSSKASLTSLLSYVIHKVHDSRRRKPPSREFCVPCELLGDPQARRSLSVRLFKDLAAESPSAEAIHRQARSLERNHRHLVNIDSSCRYSREVGSNQVSVELPSASSGRSVIDFNLRYQPDPTSSSSNASSVSSRKSLHPPAQPPPPPSLSQQSSVAKRMSSSSCRTSSSNPAPPASSSSSTTNSSSSSSNIISKPPRGWLHPDILFLQDGINFAVQYIGSLKVNTSMKILDFNTRSAIAKECINRVCEAAGRRPGDSHSRIVDPTVSRMLDESPNMERSGSSFQLTVTSLWLKLSDYDTGKAVLTHIMPNISFASGGDADTSNYVAYVAKDKTHGGSRSCYVIECTGGRAQEVITTIGQAFELRFKEYLKRAPPAASGKQQASSSKAAATTTISSSSRSGDDVEYYNDLPGKKPPLEPQESSSSTVSCNNLIDFNTEIAPSVKPEPEYINGEVINAVREEKLKAKDPFDMSPFPPLPSPVMPEPPLRKGGELTSEIWFHGPISRKESETLLLKDGDFLVRESLGSHGQYVLTGMQNSSKKHLLLVDPVGVVRTKDRSFESVSHLVNHHLENGLPIISAESTLRLLFPVPRPHY